MRVQNKSFESNSNIVDGLSFSKEICNQLAKITKNFNQKYNFIPSIVVVIVGHNQASEIYVRNKIKMAMSLGIKADLVRFEDDIKECDLLTKIKELNNNDNVHGIIVQLPLPDHISKEHVLFTISPRKDLDGLNPLNAGLLHSAKDVPYTIDEVLTYMTNNEDYEKHSFFTKKVSSLGLTIPFIPCTPLGCLHLIEKTLKINGEKLVGKNAVIFGNSNLVSKPMARLLLQSGSTVTTLHSRSQNYQYLIENADIIVSATGKKQELKNVKSGVILIDVGIRSNQNGGITGDLDFQKLSKTNKITPVPKGVGPMTVATLMLNSVLAGLNKFLDK